MLFFCVFYDGFWLAPGGVKLKMTKPGPNPRGGEKLIRVFLLRLSASFLSYLHLLLLSASFLTRFPGACHDSGGSVGYMCLFLVVICVFFPFAASFKVVLQSFSKFYGSKVSLSRVIGLFIVVVFHGFLCPGNTAKCSIWSS